MTAGCAQDYRGEWHSSPEAFSLYMQGLASRLLALGHSAEEPHFFRGELEEFYTGLRDRVNFPALVLEGSEISFTSDAADNAFKRRECSFMVVQGYDEADDFAAMALALDTCERIGDELLRRINLDKSRTDCMEVKEFRLEEVGAVPIQNVRERYMGMRYSFAASTPFWTEPDPGKWRT